MSEKSQIDWAKQWPCPAMVGTDIDEGFSALAWPCGAQPGQECTPRVETDANWVHTERRDLMVANASAMQFSPQRKRFFGFLSNNG